MALLINLQTKVFAQQLSIMPIQNWTWTNVILSPDCLSKMKELTPLKGGLLPMSN